MLWGVKTEVLVREAGAQSVSTCVPHPTWRAQSRRLAIGCKPTISWRLPVRQSTGQSAFQRPQAARALHAG